jgi:hypothetical protein
MHSLKRPNAATVIAFTALFVVLSGSAYAAKKITSGDIANGTIKVADLSSSAKKALKGQKGPAGPSGPQGPAGPAGPAGVLNAQVVEVRKTVAPGDVDGPQAFCPAGKVVVGTGFSASITHAGFTLVFGNAVGAGYINDSSIPIETSVQAICANGSAVAGVARAASNPTRTAARRQFARELAEVQAAR